ncbi:MAG TPA: energy transducer TonB [Rhizomicrobium sp.]
MFRNYIFAGLTIAALALAPAASALASETKPHVDASGNNMQPAYPATALPTKEEGSVVVSALVTTDGMVKQVRVRKSSGYADLDTAAANAVNGWKFVPGTDNGQPVDAWTSVQIVFNPPN